MPFFSDEQFEHIGNYQFNYFTQANRFDCAKSAQGLLHFALTADPSVQTRLIRELIDRIGVSPHTFDASFFSPIDIALDQLLKTSKAAQLNKKNEIEQLTLATYLLQHPLAIDPQYLDLVLGTAVTQYETATSDHKKEAVIGFYASRLCGVDIYNLLNANQGLLHSKYLAHLEWFSGTRDRQKLEGFQPKNALPIRIWSRVNSYIQEYRRAQGMTTPLLNSLRLELQRDLQTYWIIRYAEKIQAHPQREKLVDALLVGITNSIQALTENNALIMEAGWISHAVYLRFRKIASDNYEITVHNLGQGCELHKRIIEDRRTLVRPYLVAVVKDIAWGIGQPAYRYLRAILGNLFPEQPQAIMQALIYDYMPLSEFNRHEILSSNGITKKSQEDVQGFAPLPWQEVGNCVIANHNAARYDLLEPTLYNGMHKEESAMFAGRASVGKVTPYISQFIWDKPLTGLLPGLNLFKRLKEHYDVSNNRERMKALSWEQIKRYFIEPTVKDEQGSASLLKHWLAQLLVQHTGTTEQAVYCLLGEPGAGKSISLHACADYLWETLSLQQKWLPVLISFTTFTDDLQHISNEITALKSEYKFVFLLDGYDEIAISKRAEVRDRFLPMLKPWQGIIIISSRDYLVHEFPFPRIYLQTFTAEQVKEYLQKRETEKKLSPGTIKNDFQRRNILAALNNPLLLYMLLDIYFDLQAQNRPLPSTRYDIYTEWAKTWIRHELEHPKNKKIKPVLKAFLINPKAPAFSDMLLDFGSQMALALFNNANAPDWQTLYNLFCRHAADFFPQSHLFPESPVFPQLIAILPLISINQGQSYQFIHHSFAEFFLAHLIKQLYLLPDEEQALRNITINNPFNQTQPALLWQQEPGVIQFLAERAKYNISDQQRWFLILEYSRRGANSLNTNKPLQDNTHLQYQVWKQRRSTNTAPALSSAWQQHKNRQNRIKAAAANAITLLNHAGITFSGRNLSGVRIKGANLNQAIMHQTNLQHANLKNVHFKQSYLQEANLNNSKLANVQFGELADLHVPGQINCLSYSPDGRYIAVGCEDGKLYIFDWQSGQRIDYSFPFSNTGIVALAYHPVGKQLAFANRDNIIYLWEIETQDMIQELEGHTDKITTLAYHPSGQQLASGSHDTRIFLWTLKNGYYIKSILGKHKDSVTCLNYHPDPSIMQLASGSHDKTILLWDLQQHTATSVLLHQRAVYCLSYHPDGQQLIAADDSAQAYLWNINTRNLIQEIPLQAGINCIAWYPGGIQLALGQDHKISLWQMPDWQHISTLTGHKTRVMNIAYNPSHLQQGQLASTAQGEDRIIRLWQVPAKLNELPRPVPETQASPSYLAYAMQQWACANTDTSISLWDARIQTIIKTLPALNSQITFLAFHPASKQLAASTGSIVKLINIENEQVTELAGHTQDVICLAYHSSGYLLASGSKDQTVRLWNLNNGKNMILPGHTSNVKCLAYHASEPFLASGGNNIIHLWNIRNNNLLAILHSALNEVTRLAFHPSRQELVIGSANDGICVWDLTTRQEQRLSFPTPATAHQEKIIYLGYISRGAYLLSCNVKGKIMLWNMLSKTFAAEYQLSPVKQLTYDENFLITLDADGAISYWQTVYGLNPAYPHLPGWRLQWISRLTKLNVTNTNIHHAQGLSPSAARLFQQRGAQGQPD